MNVVFSILLALALAWFGAEFLGGIGFGNSTEPCCGLYDFR